MDTNSSGPESCAASGAFCTLQLHEKNCKGELFFLRLRTICKMFSCHFPATVRERFRSTIGWYLMANESVLTHLVFSEVMEEEDSEGPEPMMGR